MRVLLLTPGTGSFLCGSCTRDNALTAALRRAGHEPTIVPLYLPFELEDAPAGESAAAAGAPPGPESYVQMGGINLYLQQKLPWLPRLPRFVHDWLDSPRLLRWASTKGNMTEPAGLGEMTLSMVRGEEGRQSAEITRLVLWLEGQPTPDVVLLSNAMLLGLARRLRASLGAPVVCTLQGEQPFLDALDAEDSARCWAVLTERAREVDGFVAVSRFTAELMTERLDLDESRVHVVQNGIDLAGFGPAASRPAFPTVGFLARMCPDKGLPILVDAFLQLLERGAVPGARLVVVGVQLAEDRPGVRALERRIAAAGASGRVAFHPNVSRAEKIEHLQSFSLLSVPAPYGESFGLFVAEALACGVPAVQPRQGGFTEILEATGGGLLYDPADAGGLVLGLEALLTDPERARELGRRGREGILEHFTANRMARDVADVCVRVIAAPRSPLR